MGERGRPDHPERSGDFAEPPVVLLVRRLHQLDERLHRLLRLKLPQRPPRMNGRPEAARVAFAVFLHLRIGEQAYQLRHVLAREPQRQVVGPRVLAGRFFAELQQLDNGR